MRKKRDFTTLIILSFGFIMAVLDTTGVTLAIPRLENYLNISTIQSTWIINAYILGLGGTLLLSGNLSEKFGDRVLFMIGMFLFGISSILCGTAVNFFEIVLFRFVQGIGASFFMPSSMSLLFNSYHDSKTRAQMLGVWTSIISVATGTGSLIGGTLISSFGWRSIFFINLIFSITAIIYVLVRLDNSVKNSSKPINYLDNLLLVFSVGCLILFLTVGKQLGYLSSFSLLFFALFIIGLSFLIMREKDTKNPIIPKELLGDKAFMISNALGFIVNISLYALVVMFGMYYQNSLHFSAVISGLLILPGMIILVIGNLIYAGLVKNGNVLNLVRIGIVITIMGSLMLTIVSLVISKSSLYIMILGFAVMCFGVGILTPATTTILMESAGVELASVAGATLNANKQLGGLFGTAIVGLFIASFPGNWSISISSVFILNIVMYVIGFLTTNQLKS